jgi:hypothetical protein
MTSKITLYSDNELIAGVKQYAKERNTSVSKIVNGFFENLLNRKDKHTPRTPLTDSLSGLLKGAKLDKNDYRHHLEEKYL